MKSVGRSVVLSILISISISPQVHSEVRSHSTAYEQFIQSLRVVPQNLSQNGLKVYLLDQYFEVYATYSELPADKQKQVFDYYSQQESVEISDIDARIRQLM